jgi:hypothetical protein
VALAAYVALALHAGAADGYRFLGPIRIGPYASASQLPAGATPDPTGGYDGQFYFYIAQDPFLTRPVTAASLDSSFRYRRILYPLTAWAFSLGRRDLLPLVLIALNVVAGALLIGLLAAAATRQGRSPWWGLAVGASAGVWIPIVLDLAEPLELVLLVAGLTAESAGLLLAAALARESAAVALGTELLRLLRLRAWTAAVPMGAALVAFAFWTVFAQLAAAGAHSHSLTPGFLSTPGPVLALLHPHPDPVKLALLFPALGVVGLALGRLLVARDGAALVAAASAVIALGANADAWSGPEGYYRLLAAVPVLVFVSWCRSGDRAGLYCVLLSAASGALIAVGLLG